MHRHQALKNKIKRPRVSQAPFNVCLRARVPTAEGDAVGRNVGLSALLTYILADFKTSSRSWRNKTEGETLQVDVRGNASAGLCAQRSCGFHSLNLEGENKKSIWGGGYRGMWTLTIFCVIHFIEAELIWSAAIRQPYIASLLSPPLEKHALYVL